MRIESGAVHDWPPVTSAHASLRQADATPSLMVRPVASIRSTQLTTRTPPGWCPGSQPQSDRRDGPCRQDLLAGGAISSVRAPDHAEPLGAAHHRGTAGVSPQRPPLLPLLPFRAFLALAFP